MKVKDIEKNIEKIENTELLGFKGVPDKLVCKSLKCLHPECKKLKFNHKKCTNEQCLQLCYKLIEMNGLNNEKKHYILYNESYINQVEKQKLVYKEEDRMSSYKYNQNVSQLNAYAQKHKIDLLKLILIRMNKDQNDVLFVYGNKIEVNEKTLPYDITFFSNWIKIYYPFYEVNDSTVNIPKDQFIDTYGSTANFVHAMTIELTFENGKGTNSALSFVLSDKVIPTDDPSANIMKDIDDYNALNPWQRQQLDLDDTKVKQRPRDFTGLKKFNDPEEYRNFSSKNLNLRDIEILEENERLSDEEIRNILYRKEKGDEGDRSFQGRGSLRSRRGKKEEEDEHSHHKFNNRLRSRRRTEQKISMNRILIYERGGYANYINGKRVQLEGDGI